MVSGQFACASTNFTKYVPPLTRKGTGNSIHLGLDKWIEITKYFEPNNLWFSILYIDH